MAAKSTRICPQCGTLTLPGQMFCGKCGQRLAFCGVCGATNLAWSEYCHNCGKQLTIPQGSQLVSSVTTRPAVLAATDILERGSPSTNRSKPTVRPRTPQTPQTNVDDRVLKHLADHHGEISITRTSQELGITLEQLMESLSRLQDKEQIQKESTLVERMRSCVSCKRVIGAEETYCSYCGTKQIMFEKELQPQLDPHAMETGLTMRERVLEAKDTTKHPEYSVVDRNTTEIGRIALREKSQDLSADNLSFQDQLRLLTLVFEYTRDYVVYKGETFGEHIRWPWETMETGGDCDCKVVLLASMLDCLAFRRMYTLVLPPGTYLDTTTNEKRSMQGHAILEVGLKRDEKRGRLPVLLDPSCPDCDVNEVPETVKPFLPNFYRIPIVP